MKVSFYRKVLKNGMTVILEKRNLPIVSVAFAVRNGGVNEKEEEKGISHFIEHMLYKGTPSRNAKKIAEEIEKKGGDLNGFTSDEITAYWCKMPSKNLKCALDVLSDMVKNPLFDEKELEKERKVIFEEIKMYHDNPRLHSMDEIQKLMYNGTMKINLAGTFETMNSISREKMVKKFKEVYTSNNLILCVVGDADFKELVKFAERNFDNSNSKIKVEKFGLERGIRTEKRVGIDQANVVFAYHVPLAGDKKSYSAIVLNALMAGGMSSRLFSEIREKRNLAYAVKGDVNINKTFAYNIIYVGTMKENVEKVKGLIIEEFQKVSTSLIEKDLKEIKEQLIGNYQISMEDSQDQMVNLLAHEVRGNAKEFYNFEKEISKVKLEDVKNLAKKVVKDYSFFALIPK
ncbi:insulinase family protein [Candidatus Pacearchaeota archaeon]|jgi:predicted Zn-dependent peptidase|nr:insulinase family protein [Candidatus Pacearchaeota archaeon]HOC96663.1 pitrilysin family protein [Candidatus Pacearchaeota archaeon]HOF43929.1 pitrilysin family protein [Candidatus Pacearchaeota archaeon]HOR52132.1 pitrilysin family protein [Candidatus Pacearchaeota archaeon]HOU78957.1 pitrilysin family protein [Candidatus Pacearchaeota archaeon]